MSLTRRLILQKARHHPTTKEGSDGLEAHGFRYSFTPLPGYFSPFPHGTNPLSVIRRYSGLPGGPGRFTADSTGPLLLGKTTQGRQRVFTYRALTVYGRPSQATSANHVTFSLPSSQVELETSLPQPRTHNPYPVSHACGLAILRFRSPLLTESQLFSLPTGTEMFHFPALPPAPYVFRYG